MKKNRRPCQGPEYCAEGLCELSLEELAERLAERLGREIEMIFPERGSERIVLCDPGEGGAEYEYEVEVRPRCWVRTHLAEPGHPGRAARHTNWDPGDPHAMVFEGSREDLEEHLRSRGAVKIEHGGNDGAVVAHFNEDPHLPHFEIWSPA